LLSRLQLSWLEDSRFESKILERRLRVSFFFVNGEVC